MPVEKGMVPVIEVGAIPDNLVIIQPSGAKLGLETLAEAAFGLGIDVDAFDGIHVNSWPVAEYLEASRPVKAPVRSNSFSSNCTSAYDVGVRVQIYAA